MFLIRPEEPGDRAVIYALNLAAFEDGPEADLVDTLRATCPDHLSLVAEDKGTVVGHIFFTPVVVDGAGQNADGMGLAPMAVAPDRQRSGVGSELVRHGLELLRNRGCPFVVVLGHPEFYPRFGFERASTCGLKSQWGGVPDEAFMVIVFEKGALPAEGGIARYRGEFDAAM